MKRQKLRGEIFQSVPKLIGGLVILALLLGGASHEEVRLGALERLEDRCSPPNPRVRVLFRKDSEKGWVAYPHKSSSNDELKKLTKAYPDSASWTVAYGGKPIGKVKSNALKAFPAGSSVGLQNLLDSPGIFSKAQGEASEKWGNWRLKIHRPLVVVNQSVWSGSGSENWLSATIEANAKQRTLDCLSGRFGKLPSPKWEKSLTCKNGQLVCVSFDKPLWKIRNDMDPSPDLMWVWLSKTDSTATYLDCNMHFLDSGDYDGDGQQEWMFLVTRYNFGGYRLFSGGKLAAEFSWSYH